MSDAVTSSNVSFFESFPWSFTLYSAIAALLVFWLLLFASQHFAWLIQTVVNWKLGKECDFKLGSINLAFLGGKVCLHDVQYTDQNISVRVLAVAVGFRWWLKEVRKPGDEEDRMQQMLRQKSNGEKKVTKISLHPFRVVIHLVGVKVNLYCNSQRYELLKQELIRRTKMAEGIDKTDRDHTYSNVGDGVTLNNHENHPYFQGRASQITFSNDDVEPLFYRLSPVTKVIMQDLVLEAGSPRISERIKIVIKLLDGKHQLGPIGAFKKSSYSTINVRNFEAYFERNPDEDSKYNVFKNNSRNSRTKDTENDAIMSAILGFRNILNKSMLSNFAGNSMGNQRHLDGVWPDDDDFDIENPQEGNYSDLYDQRQEGHSRSQLHSKIATSVSSESATEADQLELLSCAKIELTYLSELPWKIAHSDTLEDGPKQNLFIKFQSDVLITYGPRFDSHKRKLYNHFLPYFYNNSDLFKLNPSEMWQHLKLDIRLKVDAQIRFLVQFRRRNSNQEISTNNTYRQAYLDISSSGSVASISVPWLSTNASGSSMEININFPTLKLIAHDTEEIFTGIPFFESSNNFSISINMEYPLDWNALRTWTISLEGSFAEILFLKDHVSFFSDIGSDWSSNADQVVLNYFVPIVYDLKIALRESKFLFFVGQSNVIQNGTLLEEVKNLMHMVLSSPLVSCAVCLPFTSYGSSFSENVFQVCFMNANCELNFPTTHPLAEVFKSKQTKHFLYARRFDISGCYRYHYRLQRDNIDSLVLRMDVRFFFFNYTS